MAIEKMALVSITGLMSELDAVLLKCCESSVFHMEHPSKVADASTGFHSLEEPNPYTPLLKRIYTLSNNISLKLKYSDYSEVKLKSTEEYSSYLSELENNFVELYEKKTELEKEIEMHKNVLNYVKQLDGLDVEFEDIFACKHIKVRFGRLPADSYSKLAYYDSKTFFFFPFSNDKDYYWGFYVTPTLKSPVVDDIFNSLYYERIRVPDYVQGTADEAISSLTAMITDETNELVQVKERLDKVSVESVSSLLKVYSKIKFFNDTFELRKYVSVVNGKFYIVGFAPYNECDAFIADLESIKSVSAVSNPHDTDARLTPPIKLKNNKLFKPFEQFVTMYGLPSYNELDPTPYVAITYTLLFGMMFGDLGQGLVIALIGLFMYLKKKMPFGQILTRIGISSAVFGCVYGSVFGYENALNPVYKALFGLEHKPIDVFEQSSMLLLIAVGVGAVLITISITISTILSFRQKNYEASLFSQNGLAGLVFYVSILGAVVLKFIFSVNVINIIFIVFLIVLPILLMVLREPLGKLIKYHKLSMPSGGIGNFIIESIVEMFEVMLSFITNTMSFLRVGGFVLSHAGMMLVVMVLSEKTSGIANPIIVILGNIFVMGLEGLIVGIQVLRLEFYEIFSRFFQGAGKPFEPVGVSYDNE